MKQITLKEVADALNLDINFVRDVLSERPGVDVSKEEQDRIFQVARKMGYDLKKLKLGKRLNLRKEIVNELISQVEANPKWKRKEILAYLGKTAEMVERVRKKAFPQEFDWL